MAHGVRHCCRHCDMVEQYRLVRDSDIRQIEVAAGDESRRPMVFKNWLQVYEWEKEPDG